MTAVGGLSFFGHPLEGAVLFFDFDPFAFEGHFAGEFGLFFLNGGEGDFVAGGLLFHQGHACGVFGFDDFSEVGAFFAGGLDADGEKGVGTLSDESGVFEGLDLIAQRVIEFKPTARRN